MGTRRSVTSPCSRPRPSPRAPHTAPQARWAQAEYRLLRHAAVAGWCTRLEAGLAPAQREASNQWRLLLVTGWPLIHEPDREIAYLALSHRTEYHSAVAGPAVSAGSQLSPADVRALLRRACYYLAEDAADDPPGMPRPATRSRTCCGPARAALRYPGGPGMRSPGTWISPTSSMMPTGSVPC